MSESNKDAAERCGGKLQRKAAALTGCRIHSENRKIHAVNFQAQFKIGAVSISLLMVSVLIQNKWRIEALWHPRPGQLVRQFMDVAADDSEFSVCLHAPSSAADVHVFAVNDGRNELAVVPGDGCLRAIYDPASFPLIDSSAFAGVYEKHGIPPGVRLRHLKLELTYEDPDRSFVRKRQLSLAGRVLHRPTYEYRFFVKGPSASEFYVTAPRGWALSPALFPHSKISGKFEEGSATTAVIGHLRQGSESGSESGPEQDQSSVNPFNGFSAFLCDPGPLPVRPAFVDYLDEKKRYLYRFDEKIHGVFREAYDLRHEDYGIVVDYSIKPSNLATISAVFQGIILLCGLVFIVVQADIFSCIPEHILLPTIFSGIPGDAVSTELFTPSATSSNSQNNTLTWPMLTTIATWITFTEINIRQERQGFFFPWRKGFKYLLLSVSSIEIILLASLFLNIRGNLISAAMFMILIGIFVALWGYCVFYSRTGGIKEKIVRK